MSVETVNENFNNLLKKHGIAVGSEVKAGPLDTVKLGSVYCQYGKEFNVTIPAEFKPVARKIESVFNAAGLIVSRGTWEHLGDEGKNLIHITGTVR